MNTAYLLIGGNIGNREVWLSEARQAIAATCGFISRQSSLYETAAWGKEDQNPFFNQVLEIQTPLSAEALLNCLLQIEQKLGRKREEKYGPRTIDIDILLFNDAIIRQTNLIIPHPQMQNRRFALVPLQEISPDILHPVFKKTIKQLLADCTDPLAVHKIS